MSELNASDGDGRVRARGNRFQRLSNLAERLDLLGRGYRNTRHIKCAATDKWREIDRSRGDQKINCRTGRARQWRTPSETGRTASVPDNGSRIIFEKNQLIQLADRLLGAVATEWRRQKIVFNNIGKRCTSYRR
jgi:hypothetical protein